MTTKQYSRLILESFKEFTFVHDMLFLINILLETDIHDKFEKIKDIAEVFYRQLNDSTIEDIHPDTLFVFETLYTITNEHKYLLITEELCSLFENQISRNIKQEILASTILCRLFLLEKKSGFENFYVLNSALARLFNNLILSRNGFRWKNQKQGAWDKNKIKLLEYALTKLGIKFGNRTYFYIVEWLSSSSMLVQSKRKTKYDSIWEVLLETIIQLEQNLHHYNLQIRIEFDLSSKLPKYFSENEKHFIHTVFTGIVYKILFKEYNKKEVLVKIDKIKSEIQIQISKNPSLLYLLKNCSTVGKCLFEVFNPRKDFLLPILMISSKTIQAKNGLTPLLYITKPEFHLLALSSVFRKTVTLLKDILPMDILFYCNNYHHCSSNSIITSFKLFVKRLAKENTRMKPYILSTLTAEIAKQSLIHLSPKKQREDLNKISTIQRLKDEALLRCTLKLFKGIRILPIYWHPSVRCFCFTFDGVSSNNEIDFLAIRANPTKMYPEEILLQPVDAAILLTFKDGDRTENALLRLADHISYLPEQKDSFKSMVLDRIRSLIKFRFLDSTNL